jgi:hypothetical protein
LSRIRAVLNQLPSWPGLAIALLLVSGLVGWHYTNAHRTCTALKADREQLRAKIAEAAASPERILDFGAAVPGEWDEMRIAQAHRFAEGQRPYDCPFGWDLTAKEREELAQAGNYTLIGFFRRGRFERYIEFRADWARFEPAPEKLARDAARFRIDPVQTNGTYRLRLE